MEIVTHLFQKEIVRLQKKKKKRKQSNFTPKKILGK